MLTRTFLHLPGVGPWRERRYWEDGILSWDDLLKDRDLFDDGPVTPLVEALQQSRRTLDADDARWFEERLGPAHAWRLTPEFDDGRIVYLDLETDSSPGASHLSAEIPWGGITVAAVWDGHEARVFLRDRDLNEIPAYLARYPVLCTFNGKAFDLPCLEQCFGNGFFRGAHLDLRYLTRAVGLTGGLKKIEALLGLERPPAVRHLSGYDAVKLWGAYRRGRKDALEPLARYNLADTINLQALLRETYNRAVACESLPFHPLKARAKSVATEAVEHATRRLIN